MNAVVFSQDGILLGTGSSDGIARIWDARTGVELANFNHPTPVKKVLFSPDASSFLTVCSDGTVRIWILPEIAHLKEPSDRATTLAELVTGMKFDQQEALRTVTADELIKARESTLQTGILDSAFTNIATWLLRGGREKFISPWRKLAVTDWAEAALENEEFIGLHPTGEFRLREDFLRFAPTYPLLPFVLAAHQNESERQFLIAYGIAKLNDDHLVSQYGRNVTSKYAESAARVLLALGDLPDARSAISRAISLEPATAAKYALRAKVARLQNDLASALEDYNEALARDPSDLEWRRERGLVAIETGELSVFKEDFSQVLQREPTADNFELYGWGLLDHGEILAALGALHRAEENAEQLQLQERDHVSLGLTLGLWLAGKEPSAVDEFSRLIDRNPDYRNAAFVSPSLRTGAELQAYKRVLEEARGQRQNKH